MWIYYDIPAFWDRCLEVAFYFFSVDYFIWTEKSFQVWIKGDVVAVLNGVFFWTDFFTILRIWVPPFLPGVCLLVSHRYRRNSESQ